MDIDYDPRNPFDLCSVTFTPIYKYAQFIRHVPLMLVLRACLESARVLYSR